MTAAMPLESPPRLLRTVGGPVACWALLLVVGLACRPPIPIDETRYLGVAWEMWNRGDLLVPYLLGEPYHHKPPLLFWAMHLGWWLLGVSEWWARLVAPLFALATVVLATHCARWWWPERPEAARLTPWLLVGALFWSVFATLTMFDMLIAASALAAAFGLALAARDGRHVGFALAGLAIGAGALGKGPVILVHVLPLMLTAPWWAQLPRTRWWRWYGGCALSLALGATMALGWAVPAAQRGGTEYAEAILWKQSAGRIATGGNELNAHGHPWWWFLPLLPALFFPWAIWPPAWRALRRLPALLPEPGVRWCVCWCGGGLLLHSLISGKQVHYLIPVFAPAMLLLARALAQAEARVSRSAQGPLSVVLGLISLVLLVGPLLDVTTLTWLGWGNREAAVQEWGAAIGLLPGIAVLSLTIGFIALPAAGVATAVRRSAITGILLLAVVHVGVMPAVRPSYDVAPLAQRIHAWQAAGIHVAWIGTYRGEYQFPGRLAAPLISIPMEDVGSWARAHPGSMVLRTFHPGRRPLPRVLSPPDEEFPYRGVRLGLWRAGRILAPPVED